MVNPYSPPAETPKERRANLALIRANLVAAVLPTVYFVIICLVIPDQFAPYLGYSLEDWNEGGVGNPQIILTLFCNLFATGPFLLGAFLLTVVKPSRRGAKWQWVSFLVLLGSMGLQMVVFWSDQFNGSRGFGIFAAAAIYGVITIPAIIIGSILID